MTSAGVRKKVRISACLSIQGAYYILYPCSFSYLLGLVRFIHVQTTCLNAKCAWKDPDWKLYLCRTSGGGLWGYEIA